MNLDIKVTRQYRYCGDCDSGYLGSEGVWCKTYEIQIWDERDATVCESYERDETPTVLIGRKPR